MNTDEHTCTVFTPTYNRLHTLERDYSSLIAQPFMDFEGLVVDDSSTDDTRTLIDRSRNDPLSRSVRLGGVDVAPPAMFIALTSKGAHA